MSRPEDDDKTPEREATDEVPRPRRPRFDPRFADEAPSGTFRIPRL